MGGLAEGTVSRGLDREQVALILERCLRALATGERVDLRRLGFWRAVRTVERDALWIEREADRIAAIDRQAFEQSGLRRFPLGSGLGALGVLALAGASLAAAAPVVPRERRPLVLLAATALLLGSTHDLAHSLVGRLVGIRFVGLYLGGPIPFEPGLKLDYATYLRARPGQRAIMHAAGALATKLVPFVVLGVATASRAARWVRWALGGLGVALVLTDVVFSTRFSDWKRVRRQLRLGERSG